MDINIDVFGSKEVDYNPNKVKRTKSINDDYDCEDSLFENQEYENEPVQLEPELRHFFVFMGTMTDEPKKILQQYRFYKRGKHTHEKQYLEDNTKSEHIEDECTKIKYTFSDEYRIKNEILLRTVPNIEDNEIFEFFVNHLIYDDTTNADVVCKKLNTNTNKLHDSAFLTEKLDSLCVKFDVEVIKLVELIAAGIMNDDFYLTVLNIFDLYVKKYYLDIYLKQKKPCAEKTIKKHIKALIDKEIGTKEGTFKNWSIKMHAYKKRNFFNPNKHYLNSSLVKSEMLESKE